MTVDPRLLQPESKVQKKKRSEKRKKNHREGKSCNAGRGSVWLERLVRDQEVGSSPPKRLVDPPMIFGGNSPRPDESLQWVMTIGSFQKWFSDTVLILKPASNKRQQEAPRDNRMECSPV